MPDSFKFNIKIRKFSIWMDRIFMKLLLHISSFIKYRCQLHSALYIFNIKWKISGNIRRDNLTWAICELHKSFHLYCRLQSYKFSTTMYIWDGFWHRIEIVRIVIGLFSTTVRFTSFQLQCCIVSWITSKHNIKSHRLASHVNKTKSHRYKR